NSIFITRKHIQMNANLNEVWFQVLAFTQIHGFNVDLNVEVTGSHMDGTGRPTESAVVQLNWHFVKVIHGLYSNPVKTVIIKSYFCMKCLLNLITNFNTSEGHVFNIYYT